MLIFQTILQLTEKYNQPNQNWHKNILLNQSNLCGEFYLSELGKYRFFCALSVWEYPNQFHITGAEFFLGTNTTISFSISAIISH